jgi:hypothetical protein
MGIADPLSSTPITFQVMTGALQSASDEHAVGTLFEGMEDMQHIDPTGAGYLDHLDVRWVGKPQASRHVRGSIGAVMATESDDLRFEGFVHPVLQQANGLAEPLRRTG